MVDIDNLNELERRLAFAREALALGKGGVTKVMNKYHTSRCTVMRGIRELEVGITSGEGYRRKSGGGRKKTEDVYPWLLDEIRAMIERERMKKEWSRVSYAKIRLMLHDEHGVDLSVLTISRLMERYGIVNHW